MHLSPGALVGDRYRLTNRIAVGGMGEVWEATDARLDRRVAVKVLKPEISADPEFLERFRVEARIAAALNHPGVAGVYDYGETSSLENGSHETAYLVMELVDGEALSAVLAREHRVSTDRSLDVLEQTALALQAAHARGVVHRDVKPGNILITPAGQVKITDFGIAKAVDAAPVTRTGMVMGTAQYISPEQALGQDAGPASDVYALAVVGHEALSGARPFIADNPITVAMMHIRDLPPPLPADVPEPTRELLALAMTKDPAQRYADGAEFAAAIAAVRVGRRAPRPLGWAGGGAAAGAAGTAEAATGVLGAPTAATRAARPLPPPRASGHGSQAIPAVRRRGTGLLWFLAVLAVGLLAFVVYALLTGLGSAREDTTPPSGPVPASEPATVTATVPATGSDEQAPATTTVEQPSEAPVQPTDEPAPEPSTDDAPEPSTQPPATTTTVRPTTTTQAPATTTTEAPATTTTEAPATTTTEAPITGPPSVAPTVEVVPSGAGVEPEPTGGAG